MGRKLRKGFWGYKTSLPEIKLETPDLSNYFKNQFKSRLFPDPPSLTPIDQLLPGFWQSTGYGTMAYRAKPSGANLTEQKKYEE